MYYLCPVKRLTRIWVWCKRIRHLNGFGVQSPFAYSFIHTVLYRKLTKNERHNLQKSTKALPWKVCHPLPQRVLRLFYKLAQHSAPTSVIYIEKEFTGGNRAFMEGCQCPAELFLETAPTKRQDTPAMMANAPYHSGNLVEKLRQRFLTHSFADLIYLDANVKNADILCALSLARCRQDSMLVIGNIYAHPSSRELWQKLTEDPRTGIAFDLYDVGIILFDKHYHPQCYTIEF